jgi:hypothetical protein
VINSTIREKFQQVEQKNVCKTKGKEQFARHQTYAFGDQGALLKNRPLDPHKTFY